MGQRLNIEIVENGEVLANAYFHWSGFTSSSFKTAQQVLDHLDEVSHESNIVRAVKLLETTGAGLTDEEEEYMLKTVPGADKISFKKAIDRNKGLIAVTEKGIGETRKWEEARVTIDLITKTVDFQALFQYSSKEEFEEVNGEGCEYPTYENIDFSNIPFDKFGEVNEYICGLINQGIYGFQTPDGKIWGFIE